MARSTRGTLVVAGLWVRPLAQSARRAGWRVIALDLFGDADTRQAADAWYPIAPPGSTQIDLDWLRQRLQALRSEPALVGWVAGSGFESLPDGLDAGGPGLALLGTARAEQQRLRDPLAFFAQLKQLHLAHPPVALNQAPRMIHWLRKDMAASGGAHIRAARPGETLDATGLCAGLAGASPMLTRVHAPAPTPADAPSQAQAHLQAPYFQQAVAGPSLSALFLANGQAAHLIALSQQEVRPLGRHPYVYQGAVGPLQRPGLQAQVEQALALLVPVFAIKGLASLDFIDADGVALILEINARPSASMLLYDDWFETGLLQAHLDAVAGQLPTGAASGAAQPWRPHAPGTARWRAHDIIFAPCPLNLDAASLARLARCPGVQDVPFAPTAVHADEPLCSLFATAPDEATLAAQRQRAHRELMHTLALSCVDDTPQMPTMSLP